MTTQSRMTRPGIAESVFFVFAGLCAVLAIVVAPLAGGTSWVGLVIAALLGWQGYRLRKERLSKSPGA